MKPLRFTLAGSFLLAATILRVQPASATLTWQDADLPPIIHKVAGIKGNSANFSIVPGKSIGRVKLGESRWTLRKMLGVPDRSAKRAGGLVEDHWISSQSQVEDPLKPDVTSGGLELSVIYTLGKAIQIGVTSREFKTPQNVSTHTSISQISRMFQHLRLSHYYYGTGDESYLVDYYDDVRKGIAYQVFYQAYPDHGPEVIYVHRPGHVVILKARTKTKKK